MTASFSRSALAIAIAVALLGAAPAGAALAPGAAAEIVSLEGAGEQRSGEAAPWSPARRTQALAAGDFVRTRAASRMALLFADQTQLRMAQDTVLQVKQVARGAQDTTTLHLSAGRAWTQTRRPDGSRLNLETPAAVAAIRGTDWDLRVEPGGRTVLTVLSGTVEFGNAQGTLTVRAHEAALAEVGKAPVRFALSQPRDRIQWVNALHADPLPHLRGETMPAALLPVLAGLSTGDVAAARRALASAPVVPDGPWAHTLAAACALVAGDLAAAGAALDAALAREPAALRAPWLMQSDLLRLQGEPAQAEARLRQALRHWPQDPLLTAELARVQLQADQPEAARATLAGSTAASAALDLARAELARREGDAPGTLAAYAQAVAAAPEDHRGWLGLGSALAERGDTVPARAHLAQAALLAPGAPGVEGERGTLETHTHHLAQAEAAFGAALQAHPADYVALTGLGLLRLRQGQPDAALDAFLRAGVMEPRYARAKTWTAVAYYQLDRHDDALASLRQARELDPRDPLPWMLEAQIRADRFEPGEAVTASREALARLPFLKSLDPLANDQRGSANLGASLAFFGLEDWALELAQESFSPYWGGSHLFLADRYLGEFNKNSALFQGFLTDPLAFGGSQRFAPLLPQPGRHGSANALVDHAGYRLRSPAITLNGMDNQHRPVAWFFKAQQVQASRMPIDVGVSGMPQTFDQSGTATAQGHVLTLGLGMEPTEQLRLFAYGNAFALGLQGHNSFRSQFDTDVRQGTAGGSYRWGPAAQTWFKLGRSLEATRLQDHPVAFGMPPVLGVLALTANPHKSVNELQLRHVEDPRPGTRWSAALEHAAERQSGEAAAAGLVQGPGVVDLLLFGAVNGIDRRYTALTLDGEHRFHPALRAEAALTAAHIRHRVSGTSSTVLVDANHAETEHSRRHDTERVLSPRLGVVLRPAAGQHLRLAWQDWMRPLGVATLTRTETAGIPVEDRLLEAGGRQRRAALQWSAEVGPRSFVSVRADHLQLRNPVSLGVDLRTPSLPFLEEMRNAQLINLSTSDLLEDTPSYHAGRLRALALGASHIFTPRWSGYAKLLLQHSSAWGPDGVSSGAQLRIPYIPRQTLALGATWASSARLYASARLVHRSLRFEDAANLTPRPAGWNLDLVAFWESADKHWTVGLGALHLGHRSPRQSARYVLDARYRF